MSDLHAPARIALDRRQIETLLEFIGDGAWIELEDRQTHFGVRRMDAEGQTVGEGELYPTDA